MPYVNKPRPYKKEYEQQKARGKSESEPRARRQKDRDEYDKKHTGRVRNPGNSPRSGKDISHAKLGANGGYKLEDPSKNRARNGHKAKAKSKKK
jgi:hypothetical protein